MKKYPLFQSQLGVFLECMIYPDTTQYNLPYHVKIDSSEDVNALSDTWRKLIHATPTLRTHFSLDEKGIPWQWPDDNMAVDIPVKSMTEEAAADYINGGFVRPFDLLGDEPLFRLEFIKTKMQIHMLMDFHHLVADGFSYVSMEREFKSIFQGKEKKPDNLFFELAQQEDAYFASEEYRTARDYFVGNLQGAEFAGLSNVSAAVGRLVSIAEYIDKKTVDEWCRKQGIDTPSLFQGAFALALGRLAHREETVYLTSYLNRANRQRMKAQGMLVNQIAIKASLPGELAARDFIRKISEDSARAYAMGRYPFTHLSAELGLKPHATFNFHPVKMVMDLGDRKYPATMIPRPTGQMDMELIIYMAGSDYEIRATSSDAVNDEERVRTFARAVKTVLRQMLDSPAAPLRDISLTGEDEVREIVALSRGETLEYDASETWVNLFLKHAQNTPRKIAVVDRKGAFTYGELEHASNCIGAWLLEKGVAAGDFVALKMGRVKEFLAAVIAVHKIGAAYVPIDPTYPEERKAYMVEDSASKAVLTEEEAAEAFAKYPAAISVNRAAPEGKAYMMYTSGSTGRPKGVVLSHRALRAFMAWMLAKFDITEHSVHALHTSFSFDISLDDLLCPIAAGGTVHILAEELRRDVTNIKEYIVKHEIGMATFSTQIGMLLVNQYPKLPLRCLMIGGEKMLPCRRTDIKLVNVYGPTEFTVWSSYHVVNQEQDKDIPIGRPAPNTWSFICDTYGHLLPQGAVGELCLAGNQLAEGYWKKPEITARSFVECPFLPGQKMYRTGDLARYNEAGELEHLGRIDNQVKLRGFRIEMGEIENCASQFKGIEYVAAAVKKDQLVLYYTSLEDARIDEEDLRKFLAESLTEYMVPSVYMPISAMPMTPNGKIDRKTLPEPGIFAVMECVPPESEREHEFFGIAAGILGTKEFGVTDNLVSLGLSSIGAMRLAGDVHRAFGLHIPVAEVLRRPTIRSLAAWTYSEGSDTKPQFSPYPKQKLYPITENQRGILIDWEQNRETAQYNIPEATLFDGVDGEALVRAVKDALSAHGYLKTRFLHAEGDVMQERRDEDEPVVSLTELDGEPDMAFFRSRIRLFDLFSDRLYHMEVYTFGSRSWLFADIHHTVYDWLSRTVFIGEVRRALAGEQLRGERLTAYDIALYEKELQNSEAYGEAKAYFDGLVEGASPALLPKSRRPEGRTEEIFALPIPAGEINRFCQGCGVTPGSFFQAAFGETLRRVTREEKPFYLTVSSGRSASPALMDSVGMFVKSLPVVSQPPGDMASEDYVKEIHRQLRDNYAREFYPYTEIVERHGLRGEIMFAYQGGLPDDEPMKRILSEARGLELDAAKFPLSLELFSGEADYVLAVEYDGRRYCRADMESFANMVKHTALGLVKEKYVKDIRLISAEEGKEILSLSAGETLEYNQEETWLNLFLEHGRNIPDKTAVVDSEGAFTYGELEHVSNSIAAYLLEKGVATGDFVALKMGRVKEFLAAVIAVHKAGAAYVPIDPAYPKERIAYILKDSEARLALTEETVAKAMAERANAEPVNHATPEGRAYMIYTSGSTGKPKGVVQSHRSLRALVAWRLAKLGITENSVHAEHASFSFDTSLNDLISPIAAGGTLHIIPEEMRRDMAGMKEYFVKNCVDAITLSTQIGMAMLNQYPDMPLRYLMMGGEKMLPCKKTAIRLINEYGPTEFTVCASYHAVDQERDLDIPIGRPVPNTWAFICDPCGQLLPRGVMGELCLAGNQLAEGYWKKPELTARSFVPCPFLPGQKMYRTGDLARYNEDGELEHLGRIDNQVKLRGFRIEMGEIENCASQFEGIEYVAAAVKKKQLVLYYTRAESAAIDQEELRRFLADTLTEYMVPTVYMPLSIMPMTPNGKIDRKALPEPELSAALEYVPPETDMECKFFEITAEILGTKDFGVTDNLVRLGLSSIGAMRLAGGIYRVCHLPLPVAKIMQSPTIRAMAALSAAQELMSYPKRELYPLMENQRDILREWEQNRGTTQYNIPEVIPFAHVEGESLVRAVKDAINAHGYLKTRFLYTEGEVMQKPMYDKAPVVSLTELDREPDQAFFQSRVLPFDLFAERLYRLEVYVFESCAWLFSDIHHIVYDGLSANVFWEEIHRALAGKGLRGETLTAFDFALYEKELQGSEGYAKAKTYFLGLAEGAVPAVFPNSQRPDGRRARTFVLSFSAEEINRFCQGCGVTPGSFLQAAFGESLRRVTGEENPFYLTMSGGRSAFPALMDSVGMFAKTLPIVSRNPGNMTVREYVRETHRQLSETYAWERYPCTELMNKQGLRSEIMFIYQGGISDKAPCHIMLELNAARFPLYVDLLAKEKDYILHVTYDGMRYSRADVKSFANMVKHVAFGLAREDYVKDVNS